MHTMQDQVADLLPLQAEDTMPAEGTLDINQLRDRGWTRQMVARFLGVPDARRPATRGGGGRPAELFRISRVRDAERMVAFSLARRTALERSSLARRSQQERRASLMRFASSLELTLPDRDIEAVAQSVRADEIPSLAGDLANKKNRAVRLLLSILADSSRRLDVFHGQPGIKDARTLLLKRKLALIASRYPALADSCDCVNLEQVQENVPNPPP